jgi:phosphoribosyl 1,2-cyclic phosphodiesterase
VVEFAIDAEVERLILFHHDPDRTDDALDAQLGLCHQMVKERNGSVQVMAAAEGTEITL